MKRIGLAFCITAFLTLFSGCSTESSMHKAGEGGAPAYFVFHDSDRGNEFVIQLTDPARIQEARAILSGKEKSRIHVAGTIVKSKAAYNPRWSYHLAPDSIHFFQLAMEVCDASMKYVEEHLAEVGGAFLPKNSWCPWASKLVRETSGPE